MFGKIVTEGCENFKKWYFVLYPDNIFKVIKWLYINKIVRKTLVVMVKYQQLKKKYIYNSCES